MLLPIARFAYNNIKSASTGHAPFELNYNYHFCIFLEENVDFCYQSKLVDKLVNKFKDWIRIYKKNFYYTQKL